MPALLGLELSALQQSPVSAPLNPDTALTRAPADAVENTLKRDQASRHLGSSLLASSAQDFFSFRTMISPAIVKGVYVLGVVVLTAIGILAILKGMSPAPAGGTSGGGGKIAFGVGVLTLGNVLWRLLCERRILYFRMLEALEAIRDGIASQTE